MDLNELLVNLKAEIARIQAIAQKLNEQILEVEKFLEQNPQNTKQKRRNK